MVENSTRIDKCMQLHNHNLIKLWDDFISSKICPLAASLQSISFQPVWLIPYISGCWCIPLTYSFAFSRVSHKWNHVFEASWVWFLSLSIIHVRFIYIMECLFILLLSSIPLVASWLCVHSQREGNWVVFRFGHYGQIC